MRIIAAVVERLDGPWEIKDLEIDSPGPGEALVRLRSARTWSVEDASTEGPPSTAHPANLSPATSSDSRPSPRTP